jgi:hypothetical protein
MNWFKFHHDALNDPKVQRLPGDLFKAWVNLLCLASQQPARGSLPPVEDCAFALRLDVLAMADLANQLANAGLLEQEPGGYSIHNWNGRQYDKPSDAPERVSERVRKHRERKSNADVTPMKRPGNATDTDTERETEQSIGADAPKSTVKAMPRNGRAHQIDPEFAISSNVQAWADKQGYSALKVERERQKFVNHFVANGGAKKDWDRTFMNWLMNGEDRGWADVKAVSAADQRRGIPA